MAAHTIQAPTELYGKDCLDLREMTPQTMMQLLDYAQFIKSEKRKGRLHRLLDGMSIAMYFEKPSNRTRVSFEVGIYDLGAHGIYLRKEEVNLGIRESIGDTARTLSRYVNGIMIRTFKHSDVEELAQYATVPVINGLTDDHHPCQVLADLLTVYETFGSLKGQKLSYIGDGNNMAHSLLLGGAISGMDVSIGCPKDYSPNPAIVAQAQAIAKDTGAVLSVVHSPEEAVKDATAVYTDVWASMGQEAEAAKRQQDFKGYQVNGSLMKLAKPNAIVLHCLPAHRGEEIDHETLEAHAGSIFEQAENRLHAQKALMVALLKNP